MSASEFKISKILRTKAQEFLGHRKKIQIINDILRHLDTGNDVPSCLLSLELIFSTLLKEKFMFIEIVPLKPLEKSAEIECKLWLKNTYEEKFFPKVVECLDSNSNKIQNQALKTAFALICNEGKCPLESISSNVVCYVPLKKLKSVLIKILFGNSNNAHLINKYTEYLTYNDILFNTWKLLPSLTQKLNNPNETYISNYLSFLGKMQLHKNSEDKLLCADGDVAFSYDENVTKKVLNKIWGCVMQWEHTKATHKQVLIILLEKVLKHLEKPLFLTDFLMDSLDIGGPVSLLALQGIFTMIQVHNLDYPDIYKKLYSMFEPEIFHTKYKARLFYLADMFLSSSHLPESLVAAFAKRLARLALIAPPEDIKIICMLVGNLILRHPGLKVLINRIDQNTTNTDPFIMEETNPSKSNAINSSLWELQSLQHHTLPSVAEFARLIDGLPSVQWDITEHLDDTTEEIFENEIKVLGKLVVLAFEKPDGMSLRRGEAVKRYWNV